MDVLENMEIFGPYRHSNPEPSGLLHDPHQVPLKLRKFSKSTNETS